MNEILDKIESAGVTAILSSNSIEFDLSASPGSKKERILLNGHGGLKLCLSARPVEGAANKAICKYFSKKLGVSKSSIQIVRGELSKQKRVRINYFFTDHKNMDYYCKRWEKLISEFQ